MNKLTSGLIALALATFIPVSSSEVHAAAPERAGCNFDSSQEKLLDVWLVRCFGESFEERTYALDVLTAAPEDQPSKEAWFWETGFDQAAQQAELRIQEYDASIDVILSVYVPFEESYEYTVRAARHARSSRSADVKQNFLDVGYAQAQQRDKDGLGFLTEQRRSVLLADKPFIEGIASSNAGPMVRAAARRALAKDDVAQGIHDFFATEWFFAARADANAYHIELIALHREKLRAVKRLHADAVRARESAELLQGAAREAALREAQALFGQAVSEAKSAESAWKDAEAAATESAKRWAEAAGRAEASTAEHWVGAHDELSRLANDARVKEEALAGGAREWAAVIADIQI